MLKAILLDLDGTLLGNSMEVFVPAYLEALGGFLSNYVPPRRLVTELLNATRVMAANDGTGPTNEEVFASAFYPALGRERSQLEPVIRRFYAEEFPKLRPLTRPVPEAPRLVEWAFDRGLQVAVATNPLFPRTAIEQRLQWAGVGVQQFPYALVTTYEAMHACKPHPAYYTEILSLLGRKPGECLMAGDDWGADVLPSTGLGCRAWWVAHPAAKPPATLPRLVGQGHLSALLAHLLASESGPGDRS
ncbi:MAG: HAD family hydrolase [Acidobacteriota bacterium]